MDTNDNSGSSGQYSETHGAAHNGPDACEEDMNVDKTHPPQGDGLGGNGTNHDDDMNTDNCLPQSSTSPLPLPPAGSELRLLHELTVQHFGKYLNHRSVDQYQAAISTHYSSDYAAIIKEHVNALRAQSDANNLPGSGAASLQTFLQRCDAVQKMVEGQQTNQGNDNPWDQVPAPMMLCTQGVDSKGQSDMLALQGVDFKVTPTAYSVRLVPSTDYLKSHHFLDALGVCMHTALKILICYSCSVALTSEMVAGHRKNHHPSYKAHSSLPVVLYFSINILHHQVPSSDMQALLKLCSELKLHVKQEDVKPPVPEGPPIQLIVDPVEGLACTASAESTYCTRDAETMRKHSRENHGTSGLTEIQHWPCLIQRLFTSIGKSYFEIGNSVLLGIKPDLKDALKAVFLPAFDVPLVVPADTERSGLPSFDAWRHTAEEIKKKHSPEEHGGVLTQLTVAIQDHMGKASTILDGHPHRLSLSKILLFGDAIP
ncbi:hypothetical protein DFJ58DRAFT_734081 [Suillus subalutaceus]|uniref:uncharacterized protein n=1 Tax=Suillus subalutaceus TaxID=48586 RepID=UPI001B86B0BB|nr:uncharacterized protein DFJ58DRAFT_734081 [Suillus subalutaceus]KAG1837985.1 hypothetical protein DFJ58DRAFT_734081 [Suillus subalutaceus]